MYSSFKWKWLCFFVSGLLAGTLIYVLYISRVFSYMSDEPAACVNCHIMGSYYKSWQNSSHFIWTTCNDCHLPQDSLINKYYFKAADGLYHAAIFTLNMQPQVIRARRSSDQVIVENCLRCHEPLVTEFTMMQFEVQESLSGRDKLCWDCHRDVPHTQIDSLSSISGFTVPYPDSPVPDWLKNML
ncbi:MAG: cytochrome c nitrite reductase small subunit [Deltaproteobacteria bacterium]|nr:cytochrome c nitrite reductase small subunit [Deltaproteobacteria bacterium]